MALPTAKPFQKTKSAEMVGANGLEIKKLPGCNQMFAKGNQ